MKIHRLLIVVAALAAGPAFAQDDAAKYPTRSIRIIVGFAAGGGNDIIARIFAEKLAADLGQPVVVENKPGAGAIVGTEYVARATPDGYTLLVGPTGMTVNQAIYAKLPYESTRDFVALSELAAFPTILVVNASSSIKSVADLTAYAKANPDKANYASASASFQLVTELFKQKTGAPMQQIPYKSATEAVMAVVSGQVTTAFVDAGPASPQIKAGTVRALAVAAPVRMADFPEVPTLKEIGTDVDGRLWTGAFAPKATPPAIAKKLEDEFVKIAKMPDVVARLKALGVDAVGSSAEAFSRLVAADIARWAEVAKSANIKAEP
ncbi:MAG: tripartite tricarboxylate transporter substrate binding protein [Bradyrhizobium sp.]|uniref:Bug family tripartite tricarboxylate transporter substrate binding protein n=1 Tax=Bradyrhizobium sp. TaxID=376 RepID=UPI001D90DD54|nr:tripartite tricarboxylate transporter substrate binding protein [Bradyrhizobium sp.]MBV9563442.1 tripartite tricarboxylate transporter substrate binding protein [Bradyrhizobium sp.]